MKSLTRALACAAIGFAATGALAQQSIKFLIPANPGGGWDQTGRTLGKVMTEAKIISSAQYDNKGGAGGTIGLAQFVNSAKGDPNQALIGGQAMVAAVELNKSPVKVQQVTPLARLVAEYSVIVVPANSPY
jgi:putative tricarboxylic transport membrane protein